MLMLVEYLRDHAQFVKHRKPELSDMLAEAADEIERLNAELDQIPFLEAKIERLREAMDVPGWDRWFVWFQLAVRGNEELVNECGRRIEKLREAAEAKGTE